MPRNLGATHAIGLFSDRPATIDHQPIVTDDLRQLFANLDMQQRLREAWVIPVASHPERTIIRVQLRQNVVLKTMTDAERDELERHLVVVDAKKGEQLLDQGVRDMEQYFVLEGMLKRVVSNAEAKEMILRFAAERDIETSYAAWRLNQTTPYSIVCVTRSRVAKLPMPLWVSFMDQYPKFKATFEYEVMNLMSEIMAHTITLHLLDAPGRVQRFERKNPDLLDAIPQKQLAAYLNLSPETLSRLRRRAKA